MKKMILVIVPLVSIFFFSCSKDLSRDGLKMNSNQKVEVGTLLDLEIDIPYRLIKRQI